MGPEAVPPPQQFFGRRGRPPQDGMRKSRFTESQIIETQNQAKGAGKIRDLPREHGDGTTTIYHSRVRSSGEDVNEAKRLKYRGRSRGRFLVIGSLERTLGTQIQGLENDPGSVRFSNSPRRSAERQKPESRI